MCGTHGRHVRRRQKLGVFYANAWRCAAEKSQPHHFPVSNSMCAMCGVITRLTADFFRMRAGFYYAFFLHSLAFQP